MAASLVGYLVDLKGMLEVANLAGMMAAVLDEKKAVVWVDLWVGLMAAQRVDCLVDRMVGLWVFQGVVEKDV